MLRTGSASKIRTTNLPRCARSCLLALQQACFNQPFDRVVTDAAYPSGFAQADLSQGRAMLVFDLESNGCAGP